MQRTIQRELGLPQLPEPPDVADALAVALCHYYVQKLPALRESDMITQITGMLNRVLDEEVRLQVGALEYQVLVPEFVRRTVQSRVGQEMTLHTSHYLDGNPMQGRVVPRLIGFLTEAELDFFELFCTVDKVGTRKALKALVRPIKEIADAIQRQDRKWLTTLPGVGRRDGRADHRHAAPQGDALRPDAPAAPARRRGAAAAARRRSVDGNVIEDAYQALMSVGHSPRGGAQPARQGAGQRQDRSSRSRRCCWRFTSNK